MVGNIVDDSEIKELKERVFELENNWKRALADYKNLQKRFGEEKISVVQFANLVLISRLVSVLDNLEMVCGHLDDVGLKLTYKEFSQILLDEGLTEIDAKGKQFDSKTMEAIEMIDGEKDKVVEVTQKGYMLKGKILRPARVKVGKKEE